jgi:hypothetical protein
MLFIDKLIEVKYDDTFLYRTGSTEEVVYY